MPTITEIRNIYQVITGEKAHKIEPLKAGFSNHSYLIDHRHVLRIKNPLKDRFYDAQQEAKAIKVITHLKISESVLFFNEKDGTKLSSFLLRTKKIFGQPTDKQLMLVAKTLRKLHRAKIVTGKSFDIFERLRYYRSRCIDYVDTFYERKIIASVERFYSEEPFVLCHNDVVNGNLLFRSNKMFLIDFEYAADNNPLFDLASFLSENDIEDEKTRRHFLKFYFNKRCDDKIYRRIVRLMALQDILWYYWAQMHYISSKQLVYKRIAHHKWKTIMKNASSQ
ncbi:MAG: choline kinase family protein [Bacilli bacterium]|jgi:thiamine kinase-like enzyme|nr:choline kinase family protein [Bacilli bacterium]